MGELKACPFCGGENCMAVEGLVVDNFYAAVCGDCLSKTTNFSEESSAIDAWNDRPSKQDCADEMYGLLEAINDGDIDYIEGGKMFEDIEQLLAKARGEG